MRACVEREREREWESKEHLNLLNVYLLFYVGQVSVNVNGSVNYHEDVMIVTDYIRKVLHLNI